MHIELKRYVTSPSASQPTTELPAAVVAFLEKTKEQVLVASPPASPAGPSELPEFDHTLIKTGPNEWNIIENNFIGKGAFGKVHQSLWKIVLEGGNARLDPTDEIVKILNYPEEKKTPVRTKAQTHARAAAEQSKPSQREQIITGINNEYQCLRANRLKVKKPMIAGDKIYLVMPNCGPSLDKCMPRRTQFDFDTSFNMAYGILNDMIALKNHGIIHRDLKPANICRREIQHGNKANYQYVFIDFGLSIPKKPDNALASSKAGTTVYMAPELAEYEASYASEIYALAGIFMEIFGANALRDKEQQLTQSQNKRRVLNTPYSAAGLFGEGLSLKIPADVDRRLLDDLRNLFRSMSSPNPKERPTIEYLIKFFSGITYRREWNKTYDNLYNRTQQLSLALGMTPYLQRPAASHHHAVHAMKEGQLVRDLYPYDRDPALIQSINDSLEQAIQYKTQLEKQYTALRRELTQLNHELPELANLRIRHLFPEQAIYTRPKGIEKFIGKTIELNEVFTVGNLEPIEKMVNKLKQIKEYKTILYKPYRDTLTELNQLKLDLGIEQIDERLELKINSEKIQLFIEDKIPLDDLELSVNSELIQTSTNSLLQIQRIYTLLSKAMKPDYDNDLYQETGSLTVKRIQQILTDADLNVLQKLSAIQQIGELELTEETARSDNLFQFFDKKQSKSMAHLYKVLAEIHIPDLNDFDSQTPTKLAEIAQQLETLFSESPSLGSRQ